MRLPLLFMILLTGLFISGCTQGQTEPAPPPEAEGDLADLNGAFATDPAGVEPEEARPTSTASPLFVQDFGPNPVSSRDYSEYQLITLLPQDRIPALDFPEYYAVKEANQEYLPEELVLGIEFNGDARAYPIGLLSRHEIVNDTVGGVRLAVTW